ncbi:MAG TPA: hypothetical protein ENH06_01115 [bacterium]|nr:hypothetical protein [bacterium]
MKHKFIRFLIDRVARCEEGSIPPKWIRVIWKILFPIQAIRSSQKGPVYYNPLRNIVTIDRVDYSMTIFEQFSRSAKVGNKFMFVERKNNDGTIIITLQDYYD